MKLSGLIIISTIIMALSLTIGGAYITIDNLIQPQGYLFEGIVLAAIGMLSLMVITLANSIGNIIILFKNIYSNQLQMQQQMIEYFNDMHAASRPRSIGDILGKMGWNSSMTITDLNTGEIISNSPIGNNIGEIFKEVISNAAAAAKLRGKGKKELHEMNREELEEELAKAVKKDDFERASDIKLYIKRLDNDTSSGDEKVEK